MQTSAVIAIETTMGLVLSLGTLTILYSQNTFAQTSNTGSTNGGNSGAGIGGYNSNVAFTLGGNTAQSGAGASSGVMTAGGSTGAEGGAGGAMIGGDSTGQSGDGGGQTVDRHLFCNTGMITPICK